jgi:hypothetical protein
MPMRCASGSHPILPGLTDLYGIDECPTFVTPEHRHANPLDRGVPGRSHCRKTRIFREAHGASPSSSHQRRPPMWER